MKKHRIKLRGDKQVSHESIVLKIYKIEALLSRYFLLGIRKKIFLVDQNCI